MTDDMREQFEKLPEIEEILESGNALWCDDRYRYIGYDADFVNGALYAYQEQQKKIDALIKTVDWHIEDCGIVEDTEYNKAWLEAMIFVKQELLK